MTPNGNVTGYPMRIATQNSTIRRRSSAFIWLLHVPYLNYIFFLFQIHGVYGMFRNYYESRKKLPHVIHGLLMVIKYALFASIGSGIILILLLYIGVNPFGEMMSFYIGHLHSLIGGMIPPAYGKYTAYLLPAWLNMKDFSLDLIIANVSVIFSTYFIFGILAMVLAYINIADDRSRFARY